MNKLDLVKRLSRECGINQTGPSTTLNQTGEYLRLVQWIDMAYQDIQLAHATWQFLRTEFTLTLAVGAATYASSLVTDFGEWIDDDFRLYLAITDEQPIEYVPWELYRVGYKVGSQRTQTGRPSVFTIKPDDTLEFFPIPDQIYTCVGEYFKTTNVMTADTDSPIFPERFHMAVMWRGVMLYGAYAQEPDKYSVGQAEYNKKVRAMEKSQLPAISWGEPLV